MVGKLVTEKEAERLGMKKKKKIEKKADRLYGITGEGDGRRGGVERLRRDLGNMSKEGMLEERGMKFLLWRKILN